MNKIRTVTIGRIGNHPTVKFAADELRKYIKLIDPEIIVDVRLYGDFNGDTSDVLWVGMSDKFADKLPAVKDASLDDAIYIDVKDFVGVITADNIRSVLVAVYRFIRELGVAFVHPGEEGEIIPHRRLEACDVHISEAATSRYRVVCIEGALAYEHIYNMIDWIPKVGMNGYQMQFMTPLVFLNRWNEHTYNASLGVDPMTREEAYAILKKAEEDIAERSLVYHGVGHGWTSESFGIPSDGWAKVDPETIPDGTRELLAMISGERKLFRNTPASTQLCYSNPKAVEAVSRTVAKYCEEHPEVDYLDVWLADSYNNVCECENCAKLRPADWYIELLNGIDELLTKKGIKTKIGMCSYNDVIWPPLEKRIKNPSRFVNFFAPITRPYMTSYDDIDMNDLGDEPVRVTNKIVRPKELRPLVRLLDGWQKSNPDLEYLVFDYHLWFSIMMCDPGRFALARVLHRDIKAFPKLKLKGLVSCQVQREGFPTNLPMTVMARTLWNNRIDFERICAEQLRDEFGDRYTVAKEYLDGISSLIAYWPDRLNEPDITVDEKRRADAEKAIELVAKYKPIIAEIAAGDFTYPLHKRYWENLLLHTEVADICARLAAMKFAGMTPDERKELHLEYHNFFRKNEPQLHRITDLCRHLMNTGAGAE